MGNQRVVNRANHFLIPVRGVFAIFPKGLAIDRRRIAMNVAILTQGADGSRETAGIIKVFHQKAARGHQVDQRRHIVTKLVPVFEGKGYADSTGVREQVDHHVSRAAKCSVDANGIFEVRADQYFRNAQIFFDHLDDAPAGKMGKNRAARIDCGNRGVVRQR